MNLHPFLLASLLGQRNKGSRIDPDLLLLLALASAAPAADRGKGHCGPTSPEKRERLRLRGLSLEDFTREHYLAGKGHSPHGSTAELAWATIRHLKESLGRSPLLREAGDAMLDQFRAALAADVAAGRIVAPTANRHLRQLRAILGYAARKRIDGRGLIRSLGPIDFLAEDPPDVRAWWPEDLAALEAQARTLSGDVAGVACNVWWPAWTLCISRIGSRVGAMMAATRPDYSHGKLLLRRENQKQKRDQRIQLPQSAAAAVEKLLAAHEQPLIWPWPFDPAPQKGGKRHWKTLFAHVRKLLFKPLGLDLPKGVCTRQFRRTVATMVDERGGNAQKLLGHSSPKTTAIYKDRRRMAVCREALLITDAPTQLEMF